MFKKNKIFDFSKEEISWIFYDWANSSYALLVLTTFFPLFFKKFIATNIPENVSTSLLGYVNTIYSIVIAFFSPIIGTLADYEKNKKKFFFIFLLTGILNTFLLTFTKENNIFFSLFLFLLSAIGFSTANLFYDSFLTDITEEKRMHWISSLGFAFGYVGSTIPFILTLLIIFFTKQKNEMLKIAFVITSIWWGVFSIPILKNVHQRFFLKKGEKKSIIKDSFIRLFNTFKKIKNYKKIFLFLLAYFFYIDGVDTIIKMAIPFALDIKINLSNNELLFIILLIQIIAAPFSLLFGYLARKKPKKLIHLLIFTIFIYIFIVTYAFFITKKIEFLIIALSVGIAQGAVQSLSRSYFAQIIPKENSGEFFGFYNIFSKFASILGPFFVAIISSVLNIRFAILTLIILFITGVSFLLFQIQRT